jgi:hypothetical protein
MIDKFILTREEIVSFPNTKDQSKCFILNHVSQTSATKINIKENGRKTNTCMHPISIVKLRSRNEWSEVELGSTRLDLIKIVSVKNSNSSSS